MFQIGGSDNTVANGVITNVTLVPHPLSLILLLSGIAGIVIVSIRMKIRLAESAGQLVLVLKLAIYQSLIFLVGAHPRTGWFAMPESGEARSMKEMYGNAPELDLLQTEKRIMTQLIFG